MKNLIWLLTIGMFGLAIYQAQAQNYMVQKLVLTDSIPILKMDSLMQPNAFSLAHAKPDNILLNIALSQDGTYTIELSATHDGHILDAKNIMGVFEFRDMLFYVQNNIIPDFMQQTKQKRNLGTSKTAISPANDGSYLFLAGNIDTPTFIFEYRNGEIQLKKAILY